ncbi:hypothetical protein BV501_09650 [Erwinia sp. OAMSP11]|nr:hypothetical protein BV501_09650 [Erwinia sp. OAMSP11]
MNHFRLGFDLSRIGRNNFPVFVEQVLLFVVTARIDVIDIFMLNIDNNLLLIRRREPDVILICG